MDLAHLLKKLLKYCLDGCRKAVEDNCNLYLHCDASKYKNCPQKHVFSISIARLVTYDPMVIIGMV